MGYVTLQDLTDRYGVDLLVSLTDRADPATGAVDESVVDDAIQNAGALIDGYLAAKYKLPLDPVPALIEPLARKLVIYDLHLYTPDQKIADEHDRAIKMLEQVSRGTIRLPSAGVEPETTDGSGARSTDRSRPFTPENMKGLV